MSNSVRPHRRQLTRLPHPWDSPGKYTGVGCHFLLQCMKVKSESEVTQSCPILSDPMDCSLRDSSIHGIFQAKVLEWGATAFSRGSSQPRDRTLQADSLSAEPPEKPKNTGVGSLSLLQGIFPTQGLNPGLLHCRQILYQLSHQGSPVSLSFSTKKKKKRERG